MNLLMNNITNQPFSIPCTNDTWSQKFDMSLYDDGDIEIIVEQVDVANNKTSISALIPKRIRTPAVKINKLIPVNSANFSNYPISGVCDMDFGLVSVDINNHSVTTPCSNGAWSFQLDLGNIPINTNSVVVAASQTDSYGNTGLSSAQTNINMIESGGPIQEKTDSTNSLSDTGHNISITILIGCILMIIGIMTVSNKSRIKVFY